tara:strand:+ start:66 stop:431 length:366 start_codon:yes stop_codon:yes gene_type:complete
MNKYQIFLIICLSLFGCERSPIIKGQDAIKVLDNDKYYFLDVRTISEHKIKSIPNTDCIPVQEIENKIELLEEYRNKKIIVYCRSGNRSGSATDILNRYGFDAYNLIGGINEWEGEIISEE